jgi:serine protease Do
MRYVFLFLFTLSLAKQTNAQLKLGDPLPQNLFVELAKLVNPTVVNISTTVMPRAQNMPGRQFGGGLRDPFFDFFEQFMGPLGPARPQQSLGTGFIIRKDGLILTNNHVVEKADVIKVQLNENDKVLYEAEILGRDARTDIALIKINTKVNLAVAALGSSKTLQVGEWVAAFGNPFGHGHTMTKGIVSAIGRELNEINKLPFIQTDASINPGNSGGPLVNAKGEVVGVNTAIDARAQGIGFAIPIDEVKSILEVLEKDGMVRRGYLGVNMYPYPLDPRNAAEIGLNTTEGALVIGTVPNSPAAKAGLKEYDLIIKFGLKEIKDSQDLMRAVQDS